LHEQTSGNAGGPGSKPDPAPGPGLQRSPGRQTAPPHRQAPVGSQPLDPKRGAPVQDEAFVHWQTSGGALVEGSQLRLPLVPPAHAAPQPAQLPSLVAASQPSSGAEEGPEPA
jgi:hypothetical protein